MAAALRRGALPAALALAALGAAAARGGPAPLPRGGARAGAALLAPALGLAAAALLPLCVLVVRTSEVVLIERLGRYNRKLKPGLHFRLPIVESVSARLTLREQVLDIPPQGCITSDNAPLSADAVVYWRIFDPEKSVYEVEQLVLAIQNLVLTQLRAEIGNLTLDETFSSRARINKVLLEDLDEATDPWGVKITRVEVRDIIPNKDILASMELQMAAERKKRAQIIQSEGQKQAIMNEAQGRAEALRIEAEGAKAAKILAAEAEQQRLRCEADGTAAALQAITAAAGGDADRALRLQALQAYIGAQKSLASSDNTKLFFFPSTEECTAKAAAVLGEALRTPAAEGKLGAGAGEGGLGTDSTS
ncbi:unnamed protein product [Prorocentrum cordatum]|uniref:Band 7 domain-containing protein n=1 Tax=Prorocentrum cordatum TaxID=2364126 RepID=A0ABN9WBR4_9DINO|nr:unnamed protein product [Polarella glacialis]